MLPAYLNDFRNNWAPTIAVIVSIVSTALYGIKSLTDDVSIFVCLFLMFAGILFVATMQREQLHQRVLFLVRASVVYMIVLWAWFLLGLIHKSSTIVSTTISNVVLGVYCCCGMWALISIGSRESFSTTDWRAAAYCVFAVLVFVLPITNASAYSNEFGIVFWHFAMYSVLYFMRLTYVLMFEREHPTWLLVQTVFGTIWLLDVPFVPSLFVYTFIFGWIAYKLYGTETKLQVQSDDPQSKIPSLKPVIESPPPVETKRAKPARTVRISYASVLKSTKPDPPIRSQKSDADAADVLV